MEAPMTRAEASHAVEDLGWRFLLGTLRTSVAVGSAGMAVEVAKHAVAACGDDADRHLRVDIRSRWVVLTLQSSEQAAVTTVDAASARRISTAVAGMGLSTDPGTGVGARRSVQLVELAVDAVDATAIRPFWRAVLGYTDEAGADGPGDPLVDPFGQGPSLWFQGMDPPRTQRNRVHFDVCVPHDEAPGRVEAALSAGGRLVSATRAPAFWVLADSEGNEACVTTWQGRDG